MNNSVKLDVAVRKALEYNIPMMQIIVDPNNEIEEKIVFEDILKNFEISHLINQNFVLYGDWNLDHYFNEYWSKGDDEGKGGRGQ